MFETWYDVNMKAHYLNQTCLHPLPQPKSQFREACERLRFSEAAIRHAEQTISVDEWFDKVFVEAYVRAEQKQFASGG